MGNKFNPEPPDAVILNATTENNVNRERKYQFSDQRCLVLMFDPSSPSQESQFDLFAFHHANGDAEEVEGND